MVSPKGRRGRASSAIPTSTSCTSGGWTNASSPNRRGRPGTVIALLPGSRRQEIQHNFRAMADAAAILHARRPDVRFLVACLRPEHARSIEEQLRGLPLSPGGRGAGARGLPIEVHAGRTAEIIHLAHSAIAKSGSVGLEMLYHGKPAVVVYQLHWLEVLGSRLVLKCPYISLVNLLAGKELFPEYLTSRLPAEAMAGHVLRWLEDPAAYGEVQTQLAALRDRVGEPGACERAAEVVLDVLTGGRAARRAG